MYTVYFIFFQVASATATRFGLSRGLLGLQYDQINASESESESDRARILKTLLLKDVLLNCEYCTKCLYLLNTSIVDAPYDECRLADNIIYDRELEFRY